MFICGLALIAGFVSFMAGVLYDTGTQRLTDFGITAACMLAYVGAKRVTDRNSGGYRGFRDPR